MIGSVVQGELFLIQIIFDLYILVFLLRIVLQWRHANFYHPISQLVIKLTDPVVGLLRRILPRFRSFDLACVVAVLILQILKFMLLYALAQRVFPGFSILIVSAIAASFKQILDLFFYAIVFRVILTWFNPARSVGVLDILYLITEPLLSPARRLIRPIAGFDLSPLVILILLKLVSIVIVQSLYTLF